VNVEPGEAVAGIMTVVAAAAAWINNRRKSAANDSRQIRNDENAAEWQTSLLESNKEKDKQLAEVRQQKEDAWLMVAEARHEIFQAQSDARLWKLKFEQLMEARTNEPARINEHIDVLTAALNSANEEIERLKARLKGLG